ncbi:MAG: TIGR03085 family metal-binding protein [Kineosporiaceae bacterium]
MPSFAAQERQALVDALVHAGSDAPTLCEGWTTYDLAAHLVAREHRPDAGLGLVVPAFGGYTERVRLSYRQRPYEDLLEHILIGPPWYSPFALPGVDSAANLAEHFVHCEDVRRAETGWQPRDLGEELQEALLKVLDRTGKLAFRKAADPVRLVRPDGAEISVGSGNQPVRLHGEPAELLLYAFGRTSAATVRIDGPDAAVARFENTALGL